MKRELTEVSTGGQVRAERSRSVTMMVTVWSGKKGTRSWTLFLAERERLIKFVLSVWRQVLSVRNHFSHQTELEIETSMFRM